MADSDLETRIKELESRAEEFEELFQKISSELSILKFALGLPLLAFIVFGLIDLMKKAF